MYYVKIYIYEKKYCWHRWATIVISSVLDGVVIITYLKRLTLKTLNCGL